MIESTSKLAIDIQGLTAGYDRQPAIYDITWQVLPGQLAAIIGPNGGGKSTLLKVLVGLVSPLNNFAKVHVFGKHPRQIRNNVAYLSQAEEVDWDFPITVLDVVLQGRLVRKKLFARLNGQDRQIAQEALARLNMAEFAERQIGALSGGQRQRVFLARAIAQDAELILLDEPNTGLDAKAQHELADIYTMLKEEGRTIIVSTHNLDCLTECFDQVIGLKEKVIAEGHPRDVLTAEIMMALFDRHFPSVRPTGEVVMHDH